jgi:hypothetical protein
LESRRKKTGNLDENSELTGGLTPVFRYNPLTAADEKIPLSVVHVNSKPQYLVFCLPLPHPVTKYGQFACGELEEPASGAGF